VYHLINIVYKGPSWPWSYGSWMYNYLCNQCLSPLMLWVRISIRARCTTLCDKFVSDLRQVGWFYPCPPISSTNKTDHHDMTEILLKVVLNTIKQINKHILHKSLTYSRTCCSSDNQASGINKYIFCINL
jgi:hypothetical protein